MRLINLEYVKPSCLSVTIPRNVFKSDGLLDFSRSHLDLIEGGKDEQGTDVARKARALNAIVSNFMCRSTSAPAQQFGANRFFLADAYEDMRPDSPFAIIRAYFSSIRPGNDRIFLNVNITTAAFFKPMLVSEFIRIMLQHTARESTTTNMLRKQVARITCERPGPKLNQEKRRKLIAGLGKVPSSQTFQTQDVDMTVFEYFNTTKG
ncbi:hypothetical protein B0J12DRAFT_24363 [Macrophomina phaseolina]|uniref:Argonaute linker 1 domain-containing protein n=1 Tax=Macrophomina phaseolina TaxID=35725 RepID=A0ABQ8GUW9_9PEZI|nr:hypothetical protein B0J12DRAFT_24363 [Macrophomina phaseolina]